MDKLEETGAFTDVVPASQDRTDDGLVRAVIEGIYVRPVQADPAAAATAPAAAPSSDVGETDPAAPGAGRGGGPA